MSLRSSSTAAFVLAAWVAASLGGCSDDGDRMPARHDAGDVTRGRDAGVDASGAGDDAGTTVPGDAAVRMDGAVDAGADASTRDASTNAAKNWWESASLTKVSWAPDKCVISVLDDPSQIPALQWMPLALGNLTGETPVVPAAWTSYRYRELVNGDSWMMGVVSNSSVVEVRNAAGKALSGFKAEGCSAELARTSRGVCVHFSSRDADGVVACGDLHSPDPLLKIPVLGFLYGSSDEIVVIKADRNFRVFIVDLSNESVHDTTNPHDIKSASIHGRDVFTLDPVMDPVNFYRGVIFRWDGAAGYQIVRDAMPLGVMNVHAIDKQLVWTETELGSGVRDGTSIYRAPWPPSGATLAPTLIRKIDIVSFEDRSAQAAGQLAIRDSRRIDLIDLANGARRKVLTGDRWNISLMYLNERSLILSLFESPKLTTYVSVRVNLSDILALPAD